MQSRIWNIDLAPLPASFAFNEKMNGREGLPVKKNALMRSLGGLVLKLMGWKITGPFPAVAKAVVIAAPHTSNWDFIIGIAAKFFLELDIHWLGKHTLFRQPYQPLFRWLGGTPVKRDSSEGIVQEIVDLFNGQDQYLLGLSPEGTRKRVERWKTGFYHIAKGAGVPIVPVAFDYSKKIIAIGEPFWPSESLEMDFGALESFYSDTEGKHQQNFNKQLI
jgi:1-acyl-sn-glycerol-3-phosphate acyltransferase